MESSIKIITSTKTLCLIKIVKSLVKVKRFYMVVINVLIHIKKWITLTSDGWNEHDEIKKNMERKKDRKGTTKLRNTL